MEDEIIIALTFLLTGTLEIVISIPLILEKIPPNYLYGFRVKKTLSNKEIWYKANKYLGKDLTTAGSILTLGSLTPLIIEIELSVAIIVYLTLVTIPLIIILFRGFRYLSKL